MVKYKDEVGRLKGHKPVVAFPDLEKTIISEGYCTLCGACEAACPVHAIILNAVPSQRYDCSKHIDLCPICYDICPHSEAFFSEALSYVQDAPTRSESLGYYRKIVLARASDQKIRQESHGGGVVSSLLGYMFDKGEVDAATVSEAIPGTSLGHRPVVGLVPDDITSALESKYFPSAVGKAFGSAVYEYGREKIAFVGVPCNILALRKLEAWHHKIAPNIKVLIGLFCLWGFSLNILLEYFAKKYELSKDDMIRFVLADDFLLYTKKEVKRIPVTEAHNHVMKRCRTCFDYSAEMADISIGSARPLEGWSTVILRTKNGESIFQKAEEAEVIETSSLEGHLNVFYNLMETAQQKISLSTMEVRSLEKSNQLLPPVVNLEVSYLHAAAGALASISVEDVMTKEVMTVRPDTPVSRLLDIMTQHHHLGYPVVDANNKLAGIVVFEDMAHVPKENRMSTLVSEVASTNVVTINPEDSVAKAFQRMTRHDIGRLVVVDKKDPEKIVGILTRQDIMHALL